MFLPPNPEGEKQVFNQQISTRKTVTKHNQLEVDNEKVQSGNKIVLSKQILVSHESAVVEESRLTW